MMQISFGSYNGNITRRTLLAVATTVETPAAAQLADRTTIPPEGSARFQGLDAA
ncbi:hypothetical protein [Mesorhizobium sp.]|uniref:hypothetical protein n=1 Tax=Mesorhizobium sp. TaxID=1871066 RepID=UPI0025E38D9C|nr:hypothetical protein [Mesorhizobium sp.]